MLCVWRFGLFLTILVTVRICGIGGENVIQHNSDLAQPEVPDKEPLHRDMERFLRFRRKAHSFEGSCRRAGLSPRTVYYWRNRYPDFFDACRLADLEVGAWYEDRMRSIAAGNGQGSAKMIALGLEVSGRWTPNPTVTVTNDHSQTVDLSGLTSEELTALVQSLTDKRAELTT